MWWQMLLIIGLFFIVVAFTYWIATKGIYKIKYDVSVTNLTATTTTVITPSDTLTLDASSSQTTNLAIGDVISTSIFSYIYPSKDILYIYIFDDGIFDNTTTFNMDILNTTSDLYYMWIVYNNSIVGLTQSINADGGTLTILTHTNQILLLSEDNDYSTAISQFIVHPATKLVITSEGLIAQ